MSGLPYSKVPQYQDDSQHSASEAPSLWSRLSFTWLSEVFAAGYHRPLDEADLPRPVDLKTSRDVSEKFQELWTEETRTSKSPRVWKCLAKLFSAWEYIYHTCSLVLYSCLRISQSVFLNFLLSELSRDSTRIGWLCFYIAGLFVSGLMKPFLKASSYYGGWVAGSRVNTAITGAVYSRVLTSLRAGRLGQLTSAHVINLISKDLLSISYAIVYAPMAVTGSIELLLTCFILWRLVGIEAVAGVSVVLLVWILQGAMKPVLQKLRAQTAVLTDKRLCIISDVISGIRTLKMNCWENTFEEVGSESRRHELNSICWRNTVYSMFLALQAPFATTATLVSVAVMVARGQVLTAQGVFTIYAFMSAIRKPALETTAYSVKYLADSLVTIVRMRKLLTDSSEGQSQAEFISEATSRSEGAPKTSLPNNPVPSLSLSHVTCQGHEHALLLDDVTLRFHGNQLVVIAGAVGSGKSSVLNAILGELEFQPGGKKTVNGKISYVPQMPWLFSGTIHENILFGARLNEAEYEHTIEACALKDDFDLLPDGDKSFIGERGVSLSGGQQSRINLARAVYSDADIYLLDDPMSAVDAKVGRHIFERCILGKLSNTLRILVTHRVEYFQRADSIVVLQNGRVRCEGKYEELLTSDPYFAELIKKKQTANREEEDKKARVGEPAASSCEPRDKEGFRTVEEDREVGSVSWGTYWAYVKAGVPLACLWIAVAAIILPQGTAISANVWLARWTNQSPTAQKNSINLWVYVALSLGTLVLSFWRAFVVLLCALRASETLHYRMLIKLLRAPVRFFDTNPSGRIMNRFSRSVGKMDEFLPIDGFEFLRFGSEVASSILLVSIANPWLILASVPLTGALFWVTVYFLRTAREVKRLEGISCSPLYAHVTETITGVDVVRAYAMEESQMGSLFRYQDNVNTALLLFAGCKQWASLRAELLSALFLAVVSSAVIVTSADKGLVALSISYAFDISTNVFTALIQFAETENSMTSVERVIVYSKLEPEPGYEYEAKVPDGWPTGGSVQFDQVTHRYYAGGPEILRDVTFRVQAGERVGIVGRTGAGKSSLISAIFRMPEPEGDILIDNTSIGALSLQRSRSAVAAISQNPLLFSGTLRFNLDPENRYDDKALWDVLDDVSLKALVQKLPDKLESHVTEGGGNFSVGERQLLCVARALLQDKKIVVLDEATANVDMKTDRLLQEVIRSKLCGRTFLTIAHRLDTIMDYDKVLVMDAGKVVEFDHPKILLERADSEFARLYQYSMKTD